MPTLRVGAVSLGLMALGLGYIYHAMPWFWASRTATIAGALLPAIWLALAMPESRVASLAAHLIGSLLIWVLWCGLVASDAWEAYTPYRVAVVASQCLMALVWARWAIETARQRRWHLPCPVAALGLLLGGAGVALATVGHWVIGPRGDPPRPWDLTNSEAPMDMLARVAPQLLPHEAGMIAAALGVALLVAFISAVQETS